MTIFDDEEMWRKWWEEHHLPQVSSRCSRCVLPSNIRGVSFDTSGICNYCKMQDHLEVDYPGGESGHSKLKEIAEKIRRHGHRKPYDVIVGVSGGADSSYLLHLAKVELGLRPLAVHFDNTWNSAIASENISRVTRALEVDLHTHVVNNEQFDDSCLAFLKAGVPDLEIQTDLALAATLNRAAAKFGISYVFEGHSFRSEGVAPAGSLYMDSRYVQSVQARYGRLPLDTLPHMWLSHQFRWMLLNHIRKIRPLWLIDYDKAGCMSMLEATYGWKNYGGHHLENRMTAFFHTYFRPRRWNDDTRVNGYSGMIRSGQMTRDQALDQLQLPPGCDLEIVELVKKRLKLSTQEFVRLMQLPAKSYRDFKTYKRTFERLRPLFYVLAKLDRIPWSFYLKYTAPDHG